MYHILLACDVCNMLHMKTLHIYTVNFAKPVQIHMCILIFGEYMYIF